MANGKLIYTPLATAALSLNGSQWLAVEDAALNLGTEHFSCNGLLYVPADTPDAEGLIISKAPWNLNWQRGWQFFYSKTYQTVGLRINDGQALPTVYLAAENACLLGAWNWFDLGITRDGEPYARVNGVESGDGYCGFGEYGFGDYGSSSDPALYAGSLDNNEPLRIGGFNGAAGRLKCSIDFLRLDFGRVLPLNWHRDEWERIRSGYARQFMDWFSGDTLACWDFNEDLLDEAELYELTHNGGGAPVYVSGWPYAVAPIEALFTHNYQFGHSFSHIPQRDYSRSTLGTLSGNDNVRFKSNYRLPFEHLEYAQFAGLLAAYTSQDAVSLFLDAERKRTDLVRLTESPELTSVAAFQADRHLWKGELVMETI